MAPTLKVTMTLHDRNSDKVQVELPGRYEVCSRCQGKGTHVNPAIDGNGLSAEDFAEDPDFEEAYFAGHYDITCQECQGQRVVPVADIAACSYAQKRLIVSERLYQRDLWEMRQEQLAEQRMGA